MTQNVHSGQKQFFVTFVKTLRKNGFHTAALFLFMMVTLNVENVLNHIDAVYNYFVDGLQRTDYCFGATYADGFAIAVTCLVVGLSAILLALYNFRFMHTKKTVNVYYSLGVSRATLFAGKFVGCVVSQLIGVALPFLITAFYNAYLYGATPAMWKAGLYYGASMSAVALYPFAMCVLCMIFSGSTVESLLCGALLTFSPSAFYYGTYLFSELFLSGANFEVSAQVKAYAGGHVESTFGGRFVFADFLYPVSNYDFGDALAQDDSLWRKGLPSVGYPLLYLGLFVLLSVAARFAFVRQKTEKAAFLGACPQLFAITVSALAGILIPAATYVFRDYGFGIFATVMFAVFLIGIAFGLFVAVVAVLLRSKEKIKAQLRTGGIMAGALLVFLVIFLTGGFGYEKRIPATEKIVEAGITFNTSQGAVGYNSYYTYKGDNLDIYKDVDATAQGENFLQAHLQMRGLFGDGAFVYFDEEQDIETIRAIHSLLIEDRRNTYSTRSYYDGGVIISYKLENGAQLTRVYNKLSVEAIIGMQSLLDSQSYYDACAGELEAYMDRNVILFSKNCTSMTDFVIEDKDIHVKTTLMQAVINDIRSGRLPMDLKSENAPLGYIAATYSTSDDSPRVQSPVYYISYSSEYLFIPIFPTMTETIAVLQASQKLQYFEDIRTPVSAKVYANPLNEISDEELSRRNYNTLQFSGYVVEWGQYDDIESRGTILPPDAVTVTDPALISQLTQQSYLTYFVDEPGYFVDLCYTDEDGWLTDTLVYVPADKIPSELK